MHKRFILPLALAMALTLPGCGLGNRGASGTASADSASLDMFTQRDLETAYDASSAVQIVLAGDSAACDSNAVQISGTTVTILDEGIYVLSGTLSNGMIRVAAEKTDKVQLVLNGVEINHDTSAAIYVLEADKVFVTTTAQSENTLSNGGAYVAIDENNIDAVIFSKSDLTLNGAGTLTIQAQAGHGIVSKDDLILTSGNYTIEAANHGLSGKDSVRIADGNYQIQAGKDGIHAENDDDASLGFLYIRAGTFEISAEGDGMSAASYLKVEDGTFAIVSGGGSENAATASEQAFGGRGFIWEEVKDTDEQPSAKGVKAGTELSIYGGSFDIDAADDALHSNANLTINAGSFVLATGDDGIHADSAVTINDGRIQIDRSYEGIEGLSVAVNGGGISLTASDDGLNAAGGNDSSGFGGRGGDRFAATEGAMINIAGGILHINASGDGIDSNGDLNVTGGETYVSGPENNGNGALDYSGEASICGGIFVAAGSAGMAQNFSQAQGQGVIMISVNSAAAGSQIVLSEAGGGQLLSWQADKAYQSVIVSCPEIQVGRSYTLEAGGTSMEIVMEDLIYGETGQMDFRGGFGGGNGQGRRPGRG